MDVVRTSPERLAGLTDYPYDPHWASVGPGADGDVLRMAYVDEGPRDGQVVVLVHGEPTWGYLYRRFVPALVERGLRVVVPDLIGFGRSDKPTQLTDYTYARHVEWLRAGLFDVLGLREVTYVGQDWGGLLGLRLLAEHPEGFARVVMANTGLPTGDVPMPQEWQRFRRMVQSAPSLEVGRMVDSGCLRRLTAGERSAYEAPFPADERHRAGIRSFPGLVPNTPDDPAAPAQRAAWEALSRSEIPLLCAFSDSDPLTRGGDRWLRSKVPGAAGQPHTVIEAAGHFLQEDQPHRFCDVIVQFAVES